ncbi:MULTISPECIES: hypothetical protein [Gammaproteobacteria]|uniref:hypothetical protein n=1 Tax=Gammaproteobacteria TaxID=1236 RepID=UPI001ADC1439|nr:MULTISPECIES: hypothetical protein [Gammaproteobacteria]MBO9484478.1 hypothetical protein [Salinisphaera sp. G21_0]MBO9496903.1 hypothetical protein [Thalassotalea sp. G20_0]
MALQKALSGISTDINDINVGGIKGGYPATQFIGVVGGGYSGSVSAMNSLKAAAFYRYPIKINIYFCSLSER